MIIDGRKIADEILSELPHDASLTLGIVMGTDAASDSFVRMKEKTATRVGVALKRFSPEQIDEALMCDGVLVQLPLENSEELIAKIPPKKDIDALGAHPLVHSPVAGAIYEVLKRTGIEAKDKKAVVVGAGKLVGIPAANLLRELGAKVSVVTTEYGSLEELKDADIVVLGVGKPNLITPIILKPGVVLIDAGTSESAGVLRGDADPACAEVASVFTPVPGGIGPIAVAMIFKNLFALAKRKP
jgi:methylenetetrahydrofolate dehydrogenase (NADP+) / methenyltetrahydrofolate cyclohydrolase